MKTALLTYGRWIVFLLCALTAAPDAFAAAAPAPIAVQLGHEEYLRLSGPVRRVSIGEGGIADISVLDGSTLRLLGTAAGRTNFSVWLKDGSAPTTYDLVVSRNIEPLRRRLADDPNFSGARVESINGKILIEGQFANVDVQKDAVALAKFMTGMEVLDISSVASEQVVQVDVRVVAISKTALNELGFNFRKLGSEFAFVATPPDTLDGFVLNPGGATRLEATTSAPLANAFNILLGSPRYSALAMISALEGSNFAQTLANPTLVVRSGEKADFLVGGEIPIPVPQGNAGNSITIEYKRFGVSLNIEPTVLKSGRISLKVKPEVSELDFTKGISIQGFSIPAIRTRETQTTVEIGDAEPLILAGLMYQTGGSVKEAIPYLDKIPVLGKFFERTRDTNEEQELIVTVVPHLVTSKTQDRSQQERIEGLLRGPVAGAATNTQEAR